MTDREKLCKEFTELTGGHWHEDQKPEYCDGKLGGRCKIMRDSNPTYENPADVLRVMFKFLSVECWLLFIKKYGLWHTEKTQQGNDFTEVKRPYIPIELLKGDTLLKTAVEFLKKGENKWND
jgi:hypothetical protein